MKHIGGLENSENSLNLISKTKSLEQLGKGLCIPFNGSHYKVIKTGSVESIDRLIFRCFIFSF